MSLLEIKMFNQRSCSILASMAVFLFTAQALPKGGSHTGGADPHEAVKRSSTALIEELLSPEKNVLKTSMLNYLKTINVDKVSNSVARSFFGQSPGLDELRKDISETTYVISKDGDCLDEFDKKLKVGTKVGVPRAPVCFDLKALSADYNGVNTELVMVNLAAVAFHEHMHHFQTDPMENTSLFATLEDDAYQISSYVMRTAKGSLPILKWEFPNVQDTDPSSPSQVFKPQLFSANPDRALRLRQAIEFLQKRVPGGCLPKDYKQAVLAELDLILDNSRLFYFPSQKIYSRNDFQISENQIPFGNEDFYIAKGFTTSTKGSDVFLTMDTDSLNSEDLALTIVEQINEHVLQWNTMRALYLDVASMALGKSKCDPSDFFQPYQKVLAGFPEGLADFASQKQAFFTYLDNQIKAGGGKGRLGSIPYGWKISSYKKTEFGFTFVPVSYYSWTGKATGPRELTPNAQKAQTFEVVFNPFDMKKDGVSGIVRDPKSLSIVTEFEFSPAAKSPLNMDPMCESREFSNNDPLRLRYFSSGGRFASSQSGVTKSTCSIKIDTKSGMIKMNRPRSEICRENEGLDSFTVVKSIDDFARVTYCREKTNDHTREEFTRILGTRTVEQFVKQLKELNEKYYRQSNQSKPESKVWMGKNILGGRLESLPGAFSIVRDESGDIYSIQVQASGVYIMGDEIEDTDDDDDNAFQCFFKGPMANKCNHRYYAN